MLKIHSFLFLSTFLATTTLLASAQEYRPLYPDDGVKIGKISYQGSEKKPDIRLAKVLKNEAYPSVECPAGIERTYMYNRIDLNGDGKPEVLAYAMGDCGGTGGYPLLILKEKANGYTVISQTTLVRQPIVVSNTKTKGWKDLIVSAAGNRANPNLGAVNHYVILKWNGSHYPSDSNMPPATNLKPGEIISGEVIIAEPNHAAGTVINAIPFE